MKSQIDLRAAHSGSVRHQKYTKTEQYSVQAVRFQQKHAGLKELISLLHYISNTVIVTCFKSLDQ